MICASMMLQMSTERMPGTKSSLAALASGSTARLPGLVARAPVPLSETLYYRPGPPPGFPIFPPEASVPLLEPTILSLQPMIPPPESLVVLR